MNVLKSACGAVIITLYAVAWLTAFGCDDPPVAGPSPVAKPGSVADPIPVPSNSWVCELIKSGKLMPLRKIEGC